MVDWDVMNHAKQIISVLPEQYFLGSSVHGANLVVIMADEGGGRTRGGGGHRGNCFMAFNTCKNLNYMSSNCITDLNH